MEFENLTERLWDLPDEAARRRFLTDTVAGATGDGGALVAQLKGEADRLLRVDIQRCLQVARLMRHVADTTGEPRQRALALLAEANARAIGLSEYQAGIDRYNEAGQIYGSLGSVVDQAQAQIGKVWPLAALGRYDEALETGDWAARELERAQAWLPLAKITGNMAAIHGRMGQDRQALAMFNRARAAYRRLGAEGRPYLVRVAYNRAIVLRNLGRFDDSIRASKRALSLVGAEQRIDRARAQQSLATTYFVLGKVNEALQLLDEVRAVFLDDGRQRDAILVELFISDCLLQLRRFRDVLEKCAQVRELFRDLGTHFEVAQAILNEAVAFAGLERYAEARASLQEARSLFAEEGNDVWLAFSDLELATISVRQGALEAGGELARRCAGTFAQHKLSIPEAQSWLVAARAASGLERPQEAQTLLQKALDVGQARGVPLLVYQAHHLLGTLAAEDGDPQKAMAQYDAAMEVLEQLRGRMMVEFRADFLEDKGVIYEDAVQLCLQLQRPQDGLAYAERAKSRALLDLLAYRLDVGLHARREEDEPLVAELTELRAERDRLYRRWESGEGQGQRGWATADDGWQQAQQDVLRIERRITELWHRLLIHNADYAQEAALWQVRTEPVVPYLDEDTLLLEYFVARGELVVFLVTSEEITAQRLPGSLGLVQQLSQLLRLNLRSVPGSPGPRVAQLATNARAILERLHGLLLGPIEERLNAWPRLVVVPHGPLHYLPFHALHDGERYLLQRQEVSYLPGASFLRYCREVQPDGHGVLSIGCSDGGRLPFTVQEARSVADLWQGRALLEDSATRAAVTAQAPGARVLHLAAHGDFRADNPLFSGLSLADGWLTTLDIFNLQLQASLVCLSACQTGRSVVGGGDELLGLMRAFLYAGTPSLVLSFWAVEDRSTAQLMQTFYNCLVTGQTKGAALIEAQRGFIEEAAGEETSHPYYWAPFFLVGSTGPL